MFETADLLGGREFTGFVVVVVTDAAVVGASTNYVDDLAKVSDCIFFSFTKL